MVVSIVAIVTIGGLEAIALMKGLDGILYATSLTFIGGIAGFNLRSIRKKLGGGDE